MACVTRLKDDTRFLECTFPRTHKLFQISSASVDEVVCRFAVAGDQDTRPAQTIVLTANFGVRRLYGLEFSLVGLTGNNSLTQFAGGHVQPCIHLFTLYQTHTHPFNGPLYGTTQVSRYQKGKTNLDFTEARDSECQWHQLGYMQVCTSLQTDNHASTSSLNFYTPHVLPGAQLTVSKH